MIGLRASSRLGLRASCRLRANAESQSRRRRPPPPLAASSSSEPLLQSSTWLAEMPQLEEGGQSGRIRRRNKREGMGVAKEDEPPVAVDENVHREKRVLHTQSPTKKFAQPPVLPPDATQEHIDQP